MVEKIAEVLGIEPFRLFLENKDEENDNGENSLNDSYLERLSTSEKQNLTKRLITFISNDIEAFYSRRVRYKVKTTNTTAILTLLAPKPD